MVKVTLIEPQGRVRIVEANVGVSLMEAAIRNGVSGIEAECGGTCSCATCHVHIDEPWFDRLAAPGPMEETMLEFAEGVTAASRLSCQIKLSDALDGLVARVVGAGQG